MPLARISGSDERIEIRKIFCIGRNYADHAKEMKAAIPEAPVFFLKPATAVVGDGELISRPHISKELHHDVEMTVLIGKGGKNILRGNAFNHVAGYGVGLDMTLRDIQSEAKKQGLPWTLAKGFDTSARSLHSFHWTWSQTRTISTFSFASTEQNVSVQIRNTSSSKSTS